MASPPRRLARGVGARNDPGSEAWVWAGAGVGAGAGAGAGEAALAAERKEGVGPWDGVGDVADGIDGEGPRANESNVASRREAAGAGAGAVAVAGAGAGVE
jgi:hypothetical protein